jgi:hypothetical protein
LVLGCLVGLVAAEDINTDGGVDLADVAILAQYWLYMDCGPCGGADLTGDGNVDATDLKQLVSEWLVGKGPGPNPFEAAPAVDQTVCTTLAAAIEFIYTGDRPLQIWMEPNAVGPNRVAVLRGKVQTRDGGPLSAVRITVLNHAEYGQTLSRQDGLFDMAVNGGGLLTVQCRKEGYLPAQRQVDVPWQDYVWLPDVALSLWACLSRSSV